MHTAQLIHRGEQFAVTEGTPRFEGECVWSWEDVAGESPRRVYPIRILVHSIRKVGGSRPVRVPAAERRRLAELAKRLLEAREPGCEVLLVEAVRGGA